MNYFRIFNGKHSPLPCWTLQTWEGCESGRDFEVVIFSEVLCNAKMTHQRLARRVTRALQSNTDAGDLGQGQLENVGQSGNNAAVSK